MKKDDTTPTQQLTALPCPYLSIPLEVAQDPDLSDGAVLLFGEVYGLCRAYGQCFASDGHFQARRGKSRSTIQRQITELSGRGHLYTVKDTNARRGMRVAERYLGGKDCAAVPENGNDGDQRPKNETVPGDQRPKNENDAMTSRPKNEAHKTPESELKNPEKRTTPSLSSGVAFSVKLSPEQERMVKTAVQLLDDARNKATYTSLFIQASERGRLDAWDIALASTLKARLKSGEMDSAPIAYFRQVLTESWKLDRDVLRKKGQRQEKAQARDAYREPAPAWLPSHSKAPNPEADSTDGNDHKIGVQGKDTGAVMPIGEAKSLSPFPVPSDNVLTSTAAISAYDRVIAALPPEQRDGILIQARAQVQHQHPAVWSLGETKIGCLMLIARACQEQMAALETV